MEGEGKGEREGRKERELQKESSLLGVMVLVQSLTNRTPVPSPDPTISRTHIYLPKVWVRIFGKGNEGRAGKWLMDTATTKAPLALVESSDLKIGRYIDT